MTELRGVDFELSTEDGDGFAGQTVIIVASQLVDFEGVALSQADVDQIKVSVFNADYSVVWADSHDMEFVTAESAWSYSWNSPGPTGRVYNVRVQVVLTDTSEAIKETSLLLKTVQGEDATEGDPTPGSRIIDGGSP